MSLAVANDDDIHGCFPPPYLADENSVPMHSWRVLLLPFMEDGSIYKQYRFDEPWNGPNNSRRQAEMPNAFRFTILRDDETPKTNYLAVVGPNRDGGRSTTSLMDLKDGVDQNHKTTN